MIILFIVLISIAVYFTTGFALACLRTSRMWRVARIMHSSDRKVETSVRQQFGWCMFVWPFYVPVSMLCQFFESTATYNNPHPYSLTSIVRKRDPERRSVAS